MNPTAKEVLVRPRPTFAAGREISHFPALTKMTGGLRGLWVIGGPTKMGKSTLALNIVAGVASPAFPVLYCDAENDTGLPPEEPAREITERIASAYGVDHPALGYLRVSRRLTGENGLEDDLARTPAPALIVVDHLQLVAQLDESTTDSNRRTAVDRVVRLCQTWVAAGYTVLALAQAGRGTYKGGRYRRPELSDLKETSEIEGAASCVAFVWAPTLAGPPKVYVPALRNMPLPTSQIQLARREWRLDEDKLVPIGKKSESEKPSIGCPVLQALNARPGITPSEIASEVKDRMSIQTVERRLKAYRTSRQVTRDAGRYWPGPVRELQGAAA